MSSGLSLMEAVRRIDPYQLSASRRIDASRYNPPGSFRDFVAAKASQINIQNEASLAGFLIETRRTSKRLWSPWEALGSEVKHILQREGACLVTGLPFGDDEELLKGVAFLLCLHTGSPIIQSSKGLMVNVAPSQKTRAVESYTTTRKAARRHSDGTYALHLPGDVGLLCVRPGDTGGEDALVDSREFCRVVQGTSEGAAALKLLTEPFPVRAPSVYVEAGSASVIERAPFSEDPFRFSFRADILEAGLKQFGGADVEKYLQAVRLIDKALHEVPVDPFLMETASMLFVRNPWMTHEREAFTGDRLMVRFWME